MSLAALLVALWILSVAIKNSSIIDLFWGPAFSVIAWPLALEHGLSPRSILVCSLLSLWGLRLGGYLAWRNLGHGEDKRYTAMRKRHGPAWWWRSFFIVFVLQGALAWIVSWPVRAAVASTSAPSQLLVSDWIGGAIVLFGIGFEALADFQLARFLALKKRLTPLPSGGEGITSSTSSSTSSRIMDSGLWRYSRHPNYFGNFVIWLGFGIFGVASGAWWSLIGPLVMTVLLVKVSGKELLEKGMSSRPGYAEYVARTSGFFPWFPKQGGTK